MMTSKTGVELDNVSVVTEKKDGRGKHPNSQSNLKPWEKGVSGNPDGRPHKFEKFKRALMEYKYADYESSNWSLRSGSNVEVVLSEIWYQAGKGSIPHINILAELGCLDED